jgi:hypothetical protein
MVQKAVDEQVFLYGQLGIQVGMLRHQAELGLAGYRVAFDIITVQQHRAAVSSGQTGEDPDGGGLACAVRPQVAVDRTGTDGEGDPGQGGAVTELLAQIINFNQALSTLNICLRTFRNLLS